jgi:hypothetical protein
MPGQRGYFSACATTRRSPLGGPVDLHRAWPVQPEEPARRVTIDLAHGGPAPSAAATRRVVIGVPAVTAFKLHDITDPADADEAEPWTSTDHPRRSGKATGTS